MESLESVTTRRLGTPASTRSIRGLAALPAVCLLFACGCTTLDVGLGGGDGPPEGDVRSVQVRWFPEVASAPDPTRGGAENKGIVGRLYLSGAVALKQCYEAEGDVTVFLYNDTVPVAPGVEQTPMEGWKIDKVTLQKLARKDVVGWGYTLFLPWSSYRPDVTRIHMKLQYDRPKGGALYEVSHSFTLNPVDDAQITTSVTHAPGVQMQTLLAQAQAQRDAAAQATRPTSVSVSQLTQNAAAAGANNPAAPPTSIQASVPAGYPPVSQGPAPNGGFPPIQSGVAPVGYTSAAPAGATGGVPLGVSNPGPANGTPQGGYQAAPQRIGVPVTGNGTPGKPLLATAVSYGPPPPKIAPGFGSIDLATNMPARSPAVVQQQVPAAPQPAPSGQGYSSFSVNAVIGTPTNANGLGAAPVQGGSHEVILEPVR